MIVVDIIKKHGCMIALFIAAIMIVVLFLTEGNYKHLSWLAFLVVILPLLGYAYYKGYQLDKRREDEKAQERKKQRDAQMERLNAARKDAVNLGETLSKSSDAYIPQKWQYTSPVMTSTQGPLPTTRAPPPPKRTPEEIKKKAYRPPPPPRGKQVGGGISMY